MPGGLDDIAAVVGLIGFSAACFENIVKGLILLSKARNYSRDVSDISLKTEIALRKLQKWDEEVRLSEQPLRTSIRQQDIDIVDKVLKRLEELVSNLDKIEENYNLKLEETKESLDSLSEQDNAVTERGVRTNDGYQKFIVRVFKRRAKPWKVLKWVTFDESRAENLLRKVDSYIKELQEIMDRPMQARMSRGIDVILRSLVSNLSSERDLHIIESMSDTTVTESHVAAAARFRKAGLLLGVMDVGHVASKPNPRVTGKSGMSNTAQRSRPRIVPRYESRTLAGTRLSVDHLSFENFEPNTSRSLASFEGDPVLLEFRNAGGKNAEWTRDRVEKTAAFLRDLDPSFHGLPCKGYVKMDNRYAYVFDLQAVNVPASGNSNSPAFQSLRDLLDQASIPSLNRRLHFAARVLETLLQLHTAYWLHKELRSENLLFFASSATPIDDFVLAEMRITGYTYSRAVNSPDMTERPESEVEADLYRHPAYLQVPPTSYRREFDMFSIGCILLEIGLWRSLSSVLRELPSRPNQSRSRGQALLKVRDELLFTPVSASKPHVKQDRTSTTMKQGILKKLEGSMGTAYTSIVVRLLEAADAGTNALSSSHVQVNDENDPLQLQLDCLEKIRQMVGVL